jgi:TM2 domain-containing membrane protein YozV
MNCHYHPEVPSSAFCQFCGKPLCKDCVRNVGGAVYCEACLAERLRAAGAPAATAAFSTGTPHPMLAAILGFIPGVGAMYNGQYAKAIAHVLIFAVLASLSDKASIFGILVAAWVFYQVFDAYQTAIARRDGLPLPNPFGLNDIAQRLGIHPAAPGVVPPIPPVPPVPPVGSASWEPVAGSTPPPSGAPYPGAAYPGAAYSGAPYPGPGGAGFVPPPGAPGYEEALRSSIAAAAAGYPPGQPYPGQPYAGQPGYNPGYAPVPPFARAYSGRDVPTGAIVLIGLGILFLFSSLGLMRAVWIGHLWPLLIIGLGIWIIVRRTRSVPVVPVPPPAESTVHTDTTTGGTR